MHIQFVKDTCLFQQNLQFKNIEHFLRFVFDIITVCWNYVMQEYRQLILLRLGGGWGHKNYTLLKFFPNNSKLLPKI